MASVEKIGGKFCVTHSRTGQVLTRGGKRACYTTKSAAKNDANKTICRVMGVCPRNSS